MYDMTDMIDKHGVAVSMIEVIGGIKACIDVVIWDLSIYFTSDSLSPNPS